MKALMVICSCLLLASIPTSQLQVSGRATPLASIRVFDEYGEISWEDEITRLDNFAIQLQHAPNFIGYIHIYNGRRMCPGEAPARGIRAKRYIVERRGVEWDRVIWQEMGYMEGMMTILEPVARGWTLQATYHIRQSTVSRDEVEILSNCRAGIRRIRQSKW